jgi:hypothetical protein
MKRPIISLWALLPAAFILCMSVAHAQSSAVVAKTPGPLAYNVSNETTLKGTVSSVLAKPSAHSGMILGAHLLVTTSSGTVDASLGRFALKGKGALSVAPGASVAITGVMKTINSKQVFLARTVSVGEQVYTIRNQRGIALSAEARQHLNQQKGAQL